VTLDPQDSPQRLRSDPGSPTSLREALELMGAAAVPVDARGRMAERLGIKSPAAPSGSGGASLAAKLGLGLSIAASVGVLAWWMQRPATPVVVPGSDPAMLTPATPAPIVSPQAGVPSDGAPRVSVPEAKAPQVISVPPITLAGPVPGSSGVASPKSTHATPPPADGTQPNEATLFHDAGAALRGGNPGRALDLVDELASRFPNGTFAQERDILRIDALLALGKNGVARERARVFLAAHPESPHRTRLEGVLSQP
jgi:hypothetical protein